MQLIRIQLNNFRCFESLRLNIEGKCVLVIGSNGSGKTSLIEALAYLCNLRSFRTHSPCELIGFEHQECCMKAAFKANDGNLHELQIVLTPTERIIKLNGKAIESYRDIVMHARMVTLTSDDGLLVTDGPEVRRSFVDRAIAIDDLGYSAIMRRHKNIVQQRHALLQQGGCDERLYHIWSEQLWASSAVLTKTREVYIAQLQSEMCQIADQMGELNAACELVYAPKIDLHDNFDSFWTQEGAHLKQIEMKFRRSMFGAHLDDILFFFNKRLARQYASRGQQKLCVLLIKIAQVCLLLKKQTRVIFLLDDFMTDFDEKRVERAVDFLCALGCQLIFTSPQERTFLHLRLERHGVQMIKLLPVDTLDESPNLSCRSVAG